MSTQTQVESVCREQFAPDFLEVQNESDSHNVPPDSETHFRVTIVSKKFIGQRLISRHRSINASLSELLKGPIHALALHTYTPEEWHLRSSGAPQSPDCHKRK